MQTAEKEPQNNKRRLYGRRRLVKSLQALADQEKSLAIALEACKLLAALQQVRPKPAEKIDPKLTKLLGIEDGAPRMSEKRT